MLFTLALALAAQNATEQSGPDLNAALNWVALIDAQRWDDSWGNTGHLFQSKVNKTQWAAAIQPVREPLGAVIRRVTVGITKSRTLPGAPDGDYEVVQYKTAFAKKAEAIETVVLSHEDGRWVIDGYFIR